MTSRKPKDTRRGSDGAQQFEWFKTSNAHAQYCDDWDIKTEPLAEAVLGLLSLGRAVMFGASRDGGAIHVTIYDGESKARSWAADSIEFDDLIALICQRVEAKRDEERPQKIRVVGD